MGASVLLVLAVTGLAAWLGPRLSGAITPFPIATTILLAFTHAQQGAPAAVGFLRAFLPAMWSFGFFCFVLAVGVVPLGRDLAFLLALAVHLVVQGAVWLGLEARSLAGEAPDAALGRLVGQRELRQREVGARGPGRPRAPACRWPRSPPAPGGTPASPGWR